MPNTRATPTKMMKKIVATAAICVLGLVGCADSSAPETGETTKTVKAVGAVGEGKPFTLITVEADGREIPCIKWVTGNASGLSCDWSVGASNE